MFISEVAETSIRGALGAFFQLHLTVGILFVYAVGSYTHWVTLSILCAIFPVLLIVAMFIVPESPVYLVKKVRPVSVHHQPYDRIFTTVAFLFLFFLGSSY